MKPILLGETYHEHRFAIEASGVILKKRIKYKTPGVASATADGDSDYEAASCRRSCRSPAMSLFGRVPSLSVEGKPTHQSYATMDWHENQHVLCTSVNAREVATRQKWRVESHAFPSHASYYQPIDKKISHLSITWHYNQPHGGRLLCGTHLYRIHMFNRVTVRSKQVATDRHIEEHPPCFPPRPHETTAPPRPSGGQRVAVRGMPCHEA